MKALEEESVRVARNLTPPLVSEIDRTGFEYEPLLSAFPDAGQIQAHFHDIWSRIEEHIDLSLTSEEAIRLFPSLVLYDIPDGTRSTLSVRPEVDVGMDAGLYCVALIHTLRCLGSESGVLMTHTSYNRMRGKEGLDRILKIISRGAKPLQTYARENYVNVHWVGIGERYELRNQLLSSFPISEQAEFEAFLLIDYSEDLVGDGDFRDDVERLPLIDVCIRHTKFNMSGGGWIPGKLLKSTFIYSQNGTLYSNWDFDELVAMCTFALLAKLFHEGEGLVKMYGDIDEVKRRYQLRELKLFSQRVQLRANPRKLFVLGSGLGLYQLYF